MLGGELAPLFVIRIELKGMDKLDEALEFAQKAAKQAYRGWDEGIVRASSRRRRTARRRSFIAGPRAR